VPPLKYGYFFNRSSALQVADFLQKCLVIRHPLVDIAYDTVPVDQVGDPAAAIMLADAAVVNQQRKGQSKFFGKIPVGFQ
jgi:hypothetical protein